MREGARLVSACINSISRTSPQAVMDVSVDGMGRVDAFFLASTKSSIITC